MKTINFITGNQNKLKEFTQIIGKIEYLEFQTKNIDLPEYQGEPEEIAVAKCRTGNCLTVTNTDLAN
jgi:inosine triphosphate pyrophosphatase